MREIQFPPLEMADSDGLLAMSQEIDVDFLYTAYSSGIFPWPMDEHYIPWFAPPERAILEFEDLHVPRRLRRHLKKLNLEFRVNCDFDRVISSCANVERKNQPGTWITDKIIKAYNDFHKEGFAFSFSAYAPDGELVGGLYGVRIGDYFAGESMFHTVTNASKFVLLNMIEYFRTENMTWIDVQMMTPLLESFGSKLISRDEFMSKLEKAM